MPLGPKAKAGDWIHDFVHSDNPRFADKSKQERIRMALGAYYSKRQDGGSAEGADQRLTRLVKREEQPQLPDAEEPAHLETVSTMLPPMSTIPDYLKTIEGMEARHAERMRNQGVAPPRRTTDISSPFANDRVLEAIAAMHARRMRAYADGGNVDVTAGSVADDPRKKKDDDTMTLGLPDTTLSVSTPTSVMSTDTPPVAEPLPAPTLAPEPTAAPTPAPEPAAAPAPARSPAPQLLFSTDPWKSNPGNPGSMSDLAWANARNAIFSVTGQAPGPTPVRAQPFYTTKPGGDNPFGYSDASWNAIRTAIGDVTGEAPGPAPQPSQPLSTAPSATNPYGISDATWSVYQDAMNQVKQASAAAANQKRGGLVKVSKQSVSYSKGMRTRRCGLCKFFIQGGACRKVEGKIDPSCWCRLYKDR